MNPDQALELSRRSTKRFRIALALIAAVFCLLLALGWWNAITNKTFDERMCDNHLFMLESLDDTLTSAKRLISANDNPQNEWNPERKAAREDFFFTYQTVHQGIIERQAELRKDYC
jgi:hypothetical protein